MSEFCSIFSGLADPRGFHGRRYKLESLLSLIVVGLLCGRNSLASIWRLSKSLTTEQRLTLGFDRWRLPSHPILTTLMQQLDIEALEAHLGQIVLAGESASTLAIDGKTLRGSRVGEHKAMHVLSAFSHEFSAVAHQEQVKGEENEITAALRVLEKLELKDKIVTGDAIFAQKNICQIIKNNQGNYLFALKDNHKSQRKAIDQAFEVYDKKTGSSH